MQYIMNDALSQCDYVCAYIYLCFDIQEPHIIPVDGNDGLGCDGGVGHTLQRKEMHTKRKCTTSKAVT